MKIDVQKFMELRDSTRARQTEKMDWRALLESKRKEIGLEPAAPSAVKKTAKNADSIRTRAAASDFGGTIEERVSALRERSAEGLPVRELGNFIDVRA